MGTITRRKKVDGSFSYTAQIRIRRQGKIVYQESQTFTKKAVAQAWIKKRETELAEPGALTQHENAGGTVAQAIERYITESEAVRPLGRTNKWALKAIARSSLGSVLARDVTSHVLVEYAQERRNVDGAGPATIINDISHLSAVFSVAEAGWGYPLSTEEMRRARIVLSKLGLIGRSKERDRRPTLEELDLIMAYYEESKFRRKQEIDMMRVVAFAIFSTLRQAEITRIRWDLIDYEGQRVLIKDMKNPREKWGNDVWCRVPDEAWRIMMSVPKGISDRPFPFNAKSVSTNFTHACKFLCIEDLRFHDLRHEGVSRLFELGWDIPQVASVSGHRNWNSLRRYTHLRGTGDKYKGWKWLERTINSPNIIV